MGDRDNLPELPQGWGWVSIEQIANVGTGATPLRSNSKYYESGTIPWVTSGSLNELFVTQADEMITELAVLETNAKVFPRHTLLVAMYGEGKTRGKVSELLIEAATNQACAALVLEGQALELKPYIKFFLQKNYDDIRRLSSGGVQPNLNLGIIKATKIPLAPLTEQHRIIAKIEELFSELDAGVELLKKLKAKLKRYRQSVLKAAVEGKLTKDWREAHQGELEPASVLLERILKERREKWEAEQLAKMKAKGTTPKDEKWKLKYKEPAAPNTANLPKLPEGWCYTFLEPFFSMTRRGIKTGPFGSLLKKHEHQPSGVPVLGIENIAAMKFIPGSKIHITTDKAVQLSMYDVKPGDILVSRSGTVGEVCVVPEGIGEARISTNLMRVSLVNKGILPFFFCLLFNGSPYILGQVSELCKGSTRNFLNQDILLSLIFTLPSYAEQQKIIEEVERCFSVIEKVEQVIDQNLKRAEKLRQSILKQAFEGKLVPQDPTDEPADKLLERIKAEKAKQEAEAKAKKKRKQPGKSQQLELF